MPFCPICKYEYREGIEKCPECDAKLVDQLESAEAIYTSLKSAHTANSSVIAGMIQEMLEEKGIASVLSNELASSIIPGLGEIREIKILVPEQRLSEAQELIKAYFEDNPDPGNFSVCSNCGAKVETDLASCPFCGEKFEEKPD